MKVICFINKKCVPNDPTNLHSDLTFRFDRNEDGEGIMLYVREDITVKLLMTFPQPKAPL